MSIDSPRCRGVHVLWPYVLALQAFAGLGLEAQRAPAVSIEGETFVGVPRDPKTGVEVFRGIPYAAAPIGDRRWKPPVRRARTTGVRDATTFGASCMQDNAETRWVSQIYSTFGHANAPATDMRVSEDCLFLNIWANARTAPAARRPVMVWIHGGSNVMGSGRSPWYDGSTLAQQNVVVVSINYRLGVFGFLAHPALTAESPQLSSGNYGLLDQLEALRWVQRHIGQFGGDSTRVTVFGESAGAIDILHLMASPLSGGLFQRAISQSGSMFGGMPRRAQAESGGLALARAAGITDTTSAASLRALRALPAAQLLSAVKQAPTAAVGPIVDGWILTDVTGRAFEQARIQRVPLLVGSNAREMTTLRTLLPPFERTVAGYKTWLKTLAFFAAPVEKLYPAATDADVEPTLINLFTDLAFTCSARAAARALSTVNVPAYQYAFTRVSPGGESLGAYHGMEITYAFGVVDPLLPRTDVDARLSRAMVGYWTRFAATGDPNGADAPTWPTYHAERDEHLELGDSLRVGSKRRAEACAVGDMASRAQWGPAGP